MFKEKYNPDEPDMVYCGRPFTDEEMAKRGTIETDAIVLHSSILGITPSRERSLALTKLEECIMWANKAIKTGGLVE
jgi:hypothetical protein